MCMWHVLVFGGCCEIEIKPICTPLALLCNGGMCKELWALKHDASCITEKLLSRSGNMKYVLEEFGECFANQLYYGILTVFSGLFEWFLDVDVGPNN